MDSETDRYDPGNEVVPNPEGAPWGEARIEAPKKVYPRSVSQLKLWRSCSLSWKFQKFDKEKSQPAAWLPQGTAFGYVAEQWELSLRVMPEMHQKEEYFQKFDEEMAGYQDVQPDLSKWLTVGRTKIETDIKNRRQRGWDQWVVYRDRVSRESWRPLELPDGSPAVEVRFAVDLGFGPLRGAVDLVKDWGDGPPTVNDLKTGNREKTPLQLAVYAVALNEMFGLDIVKGSFYYAKTDDYSPLYDLTTLDEDYLRGEFEAMERGIENRAFNANVGDACTLCPAKSKCTEWTASQQF